MWILIQTDIVMLPKIIMNGNKQNSDVEIERVLSQQMLEWEFPYNNITRLMFTTNASVMSGHYQFKLLITNTIYNIPLDA